MTAIEPAADCADPGAWHALPVAQFLRLKRQIPPLYALLALNSAALAFTHRNLAPLLLTKVIPGILILASLIRMAQWLTEDTKTAPDTATATTKLARTTAFAGVLSLGFVAWAIALDQYGGPYEHGHMAIFVAITVFGCILCLGYLPRAALLCGATVNGTFLGYCFWHGTEVMIAVGLNIAMVTTVILKVMRDNFASFVRLEESQRELSQERRAAQSLSEDNARLAESDPLTGLPNRRHFFARLDALLTAAGPHHPFCIGVLDLDRFKPVNDTYGHAQGDRLLQVLAKRLCTVAGAGAVVVRLGGDEFGLIVPGDADTGARIGQALCDAIQRPVQLGEATLSVGCSAGLAAFPANGARADALFDRADFALYHAKKHKRGKCVRFSDELEQLIRSEQALDAALQAADLAAELALVFQPIVKTETLEWIGVEALARWTSPQLGAVRPPLLFATAERLGFARSVTLTLFDDALAALAHFPAAVRLSFNLSAADICDPDTVGALLARIADASDDPARLIFEITETSFISDVAGARAALKRLRASGAAIALDDFGTGYSSLGSLHQLPLDIVKIDRSLAQRLDDPDGRRVLTAVHSLTRALDLECVLEGIETERQLIEAQLAGFGFAQGYHLSRPLPLAELLAALSPARAMPASAA